MTWEETKALLHPCLPEILQDALNRLRADTLRELRLRAGQDAQLCCSDGCFSVSWQPDSTQLSRIAEALTGHSLYARSDETSQGYVTLQGGHRMGLCGQVHRRDGQMVVQNIASLCIRIAVQRLGCGEKLLPLSRAGLLIIGPPGCGKTTLLRDLARLLSQEKQLAVIDERGELSACTSGTPQLDVGSADVLSGVLKPEAVSWLLRSMAPQIIVTDELGSERDAAALLEAQASGAEILASVHARSLNDAVRKSAVKQLVTHRCFGGYAVLSGSRIGELYALYDQAGSPLPLP